MEDPQQAFAKAFRIPHLEGNSFLYGEVPPSFKLPSQSFTSHIGPIRPANPPDQENSEKRQENPTETKTDKEKTDRKRPLMEASQRGDYAETQGSTGRASASPQESITSKREEKGGCCDGRLIAECRKLIEDVKKMKRRRGRSSEAHHPSSEVPQDSSPNPFQKGPIPHKPTPPPRQSPIIPPLDVPLKPSPKPASPPTMQQLDFADDYPDPLPVRKSISALGAEGISLYKVTREYSESRKGAKKPQQNHAKKLSLGGLKSNMSYLQEVYSVIEAHARHCAALKSDLHRLRSDYESNLCKHC